jgi:hypothetical protein
MPSFSRPVNSYELPLADPPTMVAPVPLSFGPGFESRASRPPLRDLRRLIISLQPCEDDRYNESNYPENNGNRNKTTTNKLQFSIGQEYGMSVDTILIDATTRGVGDRRTTILEINAQQHSRRRDCNEAEETYCDHGLPIVDQIHFGLSDLQTVNLSVKFCRALQFHQSDA